MIQEAEAVILSVTQTRESITDLFALDNVHYNNVPQYIIDNENVHDSFMGSQYPIFLCDSKIA